MHTGLLCSANRAGMLSPTGRCHTFDDRADGFVPGEGAGAVVLKRLEEAIADGDHIYGVIRGSGINQDGATNGITAPSANSQERLEREVYDTFRINPADIQMVEAHGTGTKLGDPIEYQALTRAFRAYTDKKEYCAIGSIKTSIGHTQIAAGIAGLIKILLSLQHKQIPASLHYQSGNSNIQFKESPFYVNTSLKEWDVDAGSKRRAAISAFGFSGTNAHMVIEEAPAAEQSHEEKPGYLIVLSARTSEQLRQQAAQLVEYCEREPQADCGNISYTLLTGRKHFNHRLACVVNDCAELIGLLKKWMAKGKVLQIYVSEVNEDRQERSSLKRYGNQSIENSRIAKNAGEYLEHLSTIADLYIQGYELEFKQMFSDDRYSRISLPSYPLARERYWVPEIKPSSAGSVRRTDPPAQRRMSFLKKQWELHAADPNKSVRRTIAILATQETRGLAEQLSQLFPLSRILYLHDIESEARQPEQQWKPYDGCIDLAGCGKSHVESIAWIKWLQQLIEHGHKEGLMMLCVSKGLESFQNSSINLSGAAPAGLYRMLQSEYSHVRSRHMDAELLIDDSALAKQIADEFLMDSENPEVCYREGRRYRACLQERETEAGDDDHLVQFPQDHVLWITGGTRGIGYLCAQHFITRHGVRRLVLTGRETLPPKDQWDSFQKQNNPLARKIQNIRALEVQGVQVQVLSVSLTDDQAIQQSLREIKNSMGPIGGVLHCAGLSDSANPAFIRKTADGIQRVLDPKTAGVEILYRSFKNEPLQFFVLFSSVSAVIPTLASGQSDYSIGNSYMDYFAEAKAPTCPIVSIQWSNWKETGMGEIKSKAYQQTGLLGMTNGEGLAFLDHILSKKIGPTVLPAMVNPEVWNPGCLLQRSMREPVPTNSQPQNQIDTVSSKTSNDLTEIVRAWLVRLFSEELKIDSRKIEIDTPFNDFGMDSILLAQVLMRIDKELGNVAIEPSAILEYPTIGRLMEFLIETYSEILRARLANENVKENKNQTLAPANRISFFAPKKEKERVSPEQVRESKIAVVGMACHFPDAENIGQFWENLKDGKDSIREVPKARWDWKEYYSPEGNQEGKSISKWGSFLEGIEEFDEKFFNITESLAVQIDPLERQWLEVSAEALGDAGYAKKDLWGKKVGVFAGARAANFARKLKTFEKNIIVGVGQNFISAHLSHIYNFKGPNMVIDTACASALTAIHLAAQSIHNGEADVALAGGTEILIDESVFVLLSAAQVLSPDGRCKTFDAKANGIGMGEGCGVLVLQRLDQAIAEGRKIYGVIDGSAINNDGNTMGITTPNPEAQYDVIQSALKTAGVKARSLSYVEAHGTGTLIGDPIELKSLTQVLKEEADEQNICGVGSVKSNIGHLLSAAGAASMIKVLLCLINRQLVPTLHCQESNPRYNFAHSPLYIVRQLQDWQGYHGVRRAGISAFGLGGHNAHLIVSDEGVPGELRATTRPRNETIFKRKRFWPSNSGKAVKAVNTVDDDALQQAWEKEEFMLMF